jgi:hypothetical protein
MCMPRRLGVRVRRTLRDGDASAGNERDEEEQEGKKPSHTRLRSVVSPDRN